MVRSCGGLRALSLPAKPVRVNLHLNGRAYAAAGQVGATLQSMAVLQAYQADLLKNQDQGLPPEVVEPSQAQYWRQDQKANTDSHAPPPSRGRARRRFEARGRRKDLSDPE